MEVLLWAIRRACAIAGGSTPPPPPDPMETAWPAVRDAAAAHGVLPQLAAALRAVPSYAMPAEIREAILSLQRLNACQGMRLTAWLFRIMDRLEAEALPALALKGPVLAGLLYGDTSARQYVDLDLLVPPEEVPRAGAILADLGLSPRFRGNDEQEHLHIRNCHARTLSSRDGYLLVDLHWGLFPHERDPEKSGGEPFRRAQRVEIDGRSIPTLGPEDTLIHLCTHGADHQWSLLGHVCDLGVLLASRDWDVPELLARADHLGRRRTLLLALALAQRIAGTKALPGIEAAWENERGLRRTLERVRERLLQLEPTGEVASLAGAWFQVQIRDDWGERFRYLRNRTFLPVMEDIAAFPLPPPLFPLYAILRPARLAGTYGPSAVRGLFTGGSVSSRRRAASSRPARIEKELP